MMTNVPRYIVRAGTKTIRTPGGTITEGLWFGIEADAELSHLLEYLSLHGYDLIGAEGMSEDELSSVGVHRFEELTVTSDT